MMLLATWLATPLAALAPLATPLEWVSWFSGGQRQYHTLFQCLREDRLWIAITVILDLTVATGYGLIAAHWWRNERHLPPIPAKKALGRMRNIFIFCALCGYVFIPLKMFWPAWRLYDLFMAALAYYTWRYAWDAGDLKVIYNEVGRTRQLEAELEKSEAESKRKSFFLNAISHDLRTPLNGLVLQASLAEVSAQSGDADAVRDAVAEIKRCAQATADLLDSFLEYGRVDWAADKNLLTGTDVAALLDEVVRLSLPAAEAKGLYLHAQVPAGLSIRTDPVKLRRILNNLVTNAVKFTDKGGVRVEVERCGHGPTRAAVAIHVIDTGIGIPAELQDRLFDEFFQLHNGERDRRKGFGLGLTIARRLTRHLGGDITVDSAPGKGSCFSVELPAVPQTAPSLKAVSAGV